ncbi:hypothetical protein [Longimicrobium sp.]|uniref:hypothetical protein n=1 Tax=Longimicrobium sp. TaxID=2029185 RepID=UPI002ED86B81
MLAACGSERDARPSQGEPAIVENAAAVWPQGAEWSVGSEPVVDIGSENQPGHQLHGVAGAIRLADGKIAVGNGGSSQVHVFDRSGRLLATAGRAGRGPEEFRSLEALVSFPGDSLAVLDAGNGRFTIISPEGRVARSVSIRSVGPGAVLVGVLKDGSFIMGVHRPAAPREGVSRDSVAYVRFSREGSRMDTIHTGPGTTQFQRISGRRVSRITVPFAPAPSATAHGSHIYVGSTDAYQIRQYGEAGRLERIIRRDVPRRPFTQAHLDRFVESFPRLGEALQGMPRPPYLPAFSAMLTDADGNLWVQDYQELGSPGSTWAVFQQSGRLLGTVRLPDGFRATDIGREHVTGVWSDEFDVEHVRSYPLHKPH